MDPINSKGSVEETDSHYLRRPNVNGAKTFYGGEIRDYYGKVESITSPITDGNGERIVIGTLAQMNPDDVQEVIKSAKTAWNNGRGEWPQMTMQQRIEAIEKVL